MTKDQQSPSMILQWYCQMKHSLSVSLAMLVILIGASLRYQQLYVENIIFIVVKSFVHLLFENISKPIIFFVSISPIDIFLIDMFLSNKFLHLIEYLDSEKQKIVFKTSA